MTRPTMAYVQMADKVQDDQISFEVFAGLERAKEALIAAEHARAKAYAGWYDSMRWAAAEGSENAARYVERAARGV